MPSLEEHLAADKRLFDRGFPEVHKLLDQFAHFPDERFLVKHRKFLHHEEGIEYIEHRFGIQAGASARRHVLDDCGHVPKMQDYVLGVVNAYGELQSLHTQVFVADDLRRIADEIDPRSNQ